MQLRGAWPEALEEARRAEERSARAENAVAAGEAAYRRRRDSPHARRARERRPTRTPKPPGRAGAPTRPGPLALGSGKTRRRCGGYPPSGRRVRTEPVQRARLLPAFIEITLAAGDLTAARDASSELGSLAEGRERTALGATAAQARGDRPTSRRRAAAALIPLRHAGRFGSPSTRRTRPPASASSSGWRAAPWATRTPLRWSSTRHGWHTASSSAMPDLARIDSLARVTAARATALTDARARGPATGRRRQDQPGDRGRARRQRAHRRPAREQHLHQAARLLARRGDRLRL